MGVYAQTNFTIECKDETSAKEALKVLKTLETDEHGNTFGNNLKRYENVIEGFEDSGRVQNLDFRCETIWNAIKNIKGVLEMSCPYMSEADGVFYSNE